MFKVYLKNNSYIKNYIYRKFMYLSKEFPYFYESKEKKWKKARKTHAKGRIQNKKIHNKKWK